MPTYDYECPAGHRFELFQRMTDDPVADCPECGQPAERKISGGAGFLFKGEGFYITDYRSDEYKKRKAAETGGAPDKGSTKTESSGPAGGAGGSGGSGGDSSTGGASSSGSSSPSSES